MFRTLIYPSSGACDYSAELPHWSCCSWFDVCWSFGVAGLEWYPCCRLKHTHTHTHTHTHIHTSDCVETVHELPLLPNSSGSEAFLHKSGAVRSVDWMFIIGMPAWRWLGEYMTLDKTFHNLTCKQEAVTARVTATFSSFSHPSRRSSLEI